MLLHCSYFVLWQKRKTFILSQSGELKIILKRENKDSNEESNDSVNKGDSKKKNDWILYQITFVHMHCIHTKHLLTNAAGNLPAPRHRHCNLNRHENNVPLGTLDNLDTRHCNRHDSMLH